MDLGSKLKALRKKENINQKELAKILEISPSTIGMYEQNRREPDLQTLVNIAVHFNVTLEYLLDIKNEPINVDELKQGSLSPELRILLSAYSKATDDDQRVILTVLDKYMSPNEKDYFSQSNPADNVG